MVWPRRAGRPAGGDGVHGGDDVRGGDVTGVDRPDAATGPAARELIGSESEHRSMPGGDEEGLKLVDRRSGPDDGSDSVITAGSAGTPSAEEYPDGTSARSEQPSTAPDFSDTPSTSVDIAGHAGQESSGTRERIDDPSVPASGPLADDQQAVSPVGTEMEVSAAVEPAPGTAADPWWRVTLVGLLLAVITAGLVGFTIAQSPRFSPLDEATHIDYVWDIAHGTLPAKGDQLSAWTLSEWACRGQANITNMPACGSDAPAKAFPGQGIQYNYAHTPLYYAVNAGIALVLSSVTPVGFFDASRIGSGIWLLAGLITLYLAMRYWRVRWSVALPATIVVAALPVVLHAATITTNDAPAVLCGALAAYLLARAVRFGNYGYVLPALMTAAAAATKILNAVPMLAIAGFLLLLGIGRWRRGGWKAGWPAIRLTLALVIPVGVVYGAWTWVQSVRGSAHYVNPIEGISTKPIIGSPIREWISTEFSGFKLGSNYFLDPKVDSVYIPLWMNVMVLLLTVASFVAIMMFGKGTAQRATGWVLMIGCLLVPLAVQLQTFVGSDGTEYFPAVSTRYAMSLIPLAVLCLALAVDARRIRLLTWLVPATGIAVMAVGIAGIAR